MLSTTIAIIKRVLEADPSVTPVERQRLIVVLQFLEAFWSYTPLLIF